MQRCIQSRTSVRRTPRRGRSTLTSLLVAGMIALGVQTGTIAHAAGGPVTAQPDYFSATVGTAFSGPVATLVDSNEADTASSFQITSITWGDTTSDQSGTVSGGKGRFVVQGSHMYETPGRYQVTVLLSDAGTPLIVQTTAIVSTCAVSSAHFGTYARAVLADQPLGFWRLDDASSSGCVVDSSGNSLNGTSYGGVTTGRPGAFTVLGDSDTATAFDGATGYVSLGDPAALQPAQVSVEAWINTSQGGGIIVRKRFYGYGLALNGAGDPVFGITDANAVSYTATGPVSVADGAWHYLVGTYNGQQVCLSVDGVQADCAPAAAIYYQPDMVAIGRDGGASDSYFNGTIDDVAIYGTALSQQQVQTHYQAEIRPQTPTTTTLTVSPATVISGQPFTISATVQGSTAPTGTVNFCTQLINTAAYSQPLCFSGITPTSPGGSTFALSIGGPAQAGTPIASFSWTVNTASSSTTGSSPSVRWITTTNTALSSTPGSTPTATWSSLTNTAPVFTTGASQQTTNPLTLPPGSYQWVAFYSGDASLLPSTASPITVVVPEMPTTVSLTSSAGSAAAGQNVTLTATVQGTASGSGTPTGTVIFLADGSTVLGSAAVNSSGNATLIAGMAAVGTHTLTAIYGGDTQFVGSISTGLSQTITAA